MGKSRIVVFRPGCRLRQFLSTLVVLAITGLGGLSWAATLTPGSSLTPPPYGLGPAGGLLLASSTTTFSAPFSFSGTLVSKVITNDPGSPFSAGLTFTYELTMDNVPGAQSAGMFTVSSYAGFSTDVCYTNGNLSFGVVPDSVARVGIGDILRFSFGSTSSPTLSPGVNSVLLVVRTDAQTWQGTLAGIINGSTANVSTFAPMVIPEPSTATLCIGGGIAMCLFMIRRQRH